MSLIRKHVAVLQAWACLDLVDFGLLRIAHTEKYLTYILADKFIDTC